MRNSKLIPFPNHYESLRSKLCFVRTPVPHRGPFNTSKLFIEMANNSLRHMRYAVLSAYPSLYMWGAGVWSDGVEIGKILLRLQINCDNREVLDSASRQMRFTAALHLLEEKMGLLSIHIAHRNAPHLQSDRRHNEALLNLCQMCATG